MEKHQTAGRLVIRRPCAVVSGENFLKKCHAWIYSHSVNKVSETDNVGIFHFLEALEDCKLR